MNFKNKKVLITAGPTWVPIDKVRVISNTSSGTTGVLLAEGLKNAGAKVTLLLGPIGNCQLSKGISIIRFRFFDELKDSLLKELRKGQYDILIHSAAVSDYKLLKPYAKKVKSNLKRWALNLVPTQKLIGLARKAAPHIFLVPFKFESESKSRSELIKKASLLKYARPQLVVANTLCKNRYIAYILGVKKVYGPFMSKEKMTDNLIKLLILDTPVCPKEKD